MDLNPYIDWLAGEWIWIVVAVLSLLLLLNLGDYLRKR